MEVITDFEPNYDVKDFDMSFKDVDPNKGIVTGYFASFGTLDFDGDIIEPGSFRKTISERGPAGKQKIKFLLDHHKEKALGKLIELKEDSFGLYYEGKVGRHGLGKDFLLMVEDGIIDQHSFGYKTIKEQWDSQAKANIIKEVIMFEGSAIQFLGANENTPITGMKSLKNVMGHIQKLEKFIKSSNATDETLIQLSEKLISLHKLIEPEKTTQKEEKPIVIDLKSMFETSWKNINGN